MNMAYDDVVDAFKSGTVDAVNAGTQRAATIMTSNYAEDFASCPIPGEKEGESAPAYVAGQTLAIGKYAQDPEMAMDFIKFYLSEENQTSGYLQIVCRFVQVCLMMNPSKRMRCMTVCRCGVNMQKPVKLHFIRQITQNSVQNL